MHEITYTFEELPVLSEGGVCAGLMNGTAEVKFDADGDFYVGKIFIDGYRKRADGKGYDHAQIELEYDPSIPETSKTIHGHLYLAIWEELTDGSFKSHVETKVSEALDLAGIPSRDMNAEHRLTARELV